MIKIQIFISGSVSWAGIIFPEPLKKIIALAKLEIRTKESWSLVIFSVHPAFTA